MDLAAFEVKKKKKGIEINYLSVCPFFSLIFICSVLELVRLKNKWEASCHSPLSVEGK